MILALPFFFGLILIEYLYSRRLGLEVYRRGETLSNLLNGAGQGVINLVWFGFIVVFHDWLFTHYAQISWDPNRWTSWLILAVLMDFCWYWAHRCSHRVNLFAASHVTHHHAAEFNHASALRQSWTSRLFIYVFFAPLAFLGFDAKWVVSAQLISGAFQFLTHNGIHRKKIPGIDLLFVIPRTHYVHHGIHFPYLDKNFGGTLIIWDRIFGTYQDLDEKIPITIGTHERFNWLNPFSSNLIYFRQLGKAMAAVPGIFSKLALLFGTPEELAAILEKLPKEKTRIGKPRDLTSAQRWQLRFAGAGVLALSIATQVTPDWGILRVALGLSVFASIFFVARLGFA
ncbi:MAG: sterol desaturase family protein [Bdellovibrionales bacterium]|nr:sterol desaturase family protein [Bdellovibrionales bacterium]